MKRSLFACRIAGLWAVLVLAGAARADVLDQVDAVQNAVNEAALAVAGERWGAADEDAWKRETAAFGVALRSQDGKNLWAAAVAGEGLEIPRRVGRAQGILQQVLAVEMLDAYRAGQLQEAREWRASIKLPKHATAVDGLLALQRMSGSAALREEVARVLARETIIWQSTRARERADELRRLATAERATAALIGLRAEEVQALAEFPGSLLAVAGAEGKGVAGGAVPALPTADVASVVAWKAATEARLPDLLSEDDVTRRERLVLKLLRLIPMEYKAGVRDGQVVIPVEYREAQMFTVQAQQLLAEVRPSWGRTKAEPLARQGVVLEEQFAVLEEAIAVKADYVPVEESSARLMQILQDDFGVSLRKAGKGVDVVQESALEVRSLLGQSLQEAKAGRWSQAHALRLEAYTTFDLEIEKRVLPRDPTLAIQAERNFLDGGTQSLGIKAMLDARAKDPDLSLAYEQTLAGLDECVALLRVGISPATVSFTAFTIMLREGLEAVVILAALLAGLRGVENAVTRRRVVSGAWLAVVASVVTFVVSRSLIQSLSRHGETLEAVISMLAVIILLMVTNWVFHKFYWSGWNSKLRELKEKAQGQRGERWEAVSMVGVGFLTIYREGFETTLFMQSLILEGGWPATLTGLGAGIVAIAVAGTAIFMLGAKLPYRKLLVVTGFLVVSILATFVGSTVRLFQTVGWLPVHPIHGLDIPSWVGQWFGLYPSWEGLLIPLGALGYVCGAWVWVKWQARAEAARESAPQRVPIEVVMGK